MIVDIWLSCKCDRNQNHLDSIPIDDSDHISLAMTDDWLALSYYEQPMITIYSIKAGLIEYNSQISGPQDIYFGRSIDINKDNIAVGAPGYNLGKGAVYLFTLDENTWNETLLEHESNEPISFGFSLDYNDNSLVVGAPGETNNLGSRYPWFSQHGQVYFYAKNDAGLVKLIKTFDLQENEAAVSAEYGYSVDYNEGNNLFVIGAPGYRSGANRLRVGAYFIYEYDGSDFILKISYYGDYSTGINLYGIHVGVVPSGVIIMGWNLNYTKRGIRYYALTEISASEETSNTESESDLGSELESESTTTPTLTNARTESGGGSIGVLLLTALLVRFRKYP